MFNLFPASIKQNKNNKRFLGELGHFPVYLDI